MYKNILLLAGAALALALVPLVGIAAGHAGREIATATTHSRMAANAADVSTAHMHFHHVINCLVGPKGKQFDAAPGNPCKGMGNGALNDVSVKSAAHAKLLEALTVAESGLRANRLTLTQRDALHIAKILKSIHTND